MAQASCAGDAGAADNETWQHARDTLVCESGVGILMREGDKGSCRGADGPIVYVCFL